MGFVFCLVGFVFGFFLKEKETCYEQKVKNKKEGGSILLLFMDPATDLP